MSGLAKFAWAGETMASRRRCGARMTARRLASRLLASTAAASAPAFAADDVGIFVSSALTAEAPVASLNERLAASSKPRTPGQITLLSALDDAAAAQSIDDTFFDEVERAEEAIASPEPPSPEAAAPAPADNAPASIQGEDEVLFEADEVWRETDESPIIADGNVRAYFGARYLRADRLSYDPATDIVVAEGDVSITDEDLNTAFAGRVELTGDLRDGIAENFSALLEQNARLAGDTAIQEQGARTYLTNAVYTACNVCKENGDGKIPTWRIRALRVTRDLERKVVRFRHAFFELKGVPLLYVPFIQAPDPSVERQSGFLAPTIGASSRLGFNFELPYYFAISNHQDATFYPKYTSNDGVLWQAEYRRRDVSGEHAVQAGIIDFDNTADPAAGDVPGLRWHVFARGRRDISNKWSLGYDMERVSDNPYLRRYSVERQGELRQEISTARAGLLRSNATLAYDGGDTEFSASILMFQDLRTISICDLDDGSRLPIQRANCASIRQTIDPNTVEGPSIRDLTPLVAPQLHFRHNFSEPIVGGNAVINADLAYLQRTVGVDTQRLSASAFWEREHITQGGHRFRLFGELRGDAFYYQDLDEGTEVRQGVPGDTDDFVARFAPTAGVEWSYPLMRRTGSARLFLEPRVQLVASPANKNPMEIYNQDSLSTEFDFAGLFDYNKATGIDAFEDGQRANIGVIASAEFDNGLAFNASVGGQFRLQESDAFFISTGLGEKRSDIVASAGMKYKDKFGLQNTLRIDDDTGSIQRAESLAYFNVWRFSGGVNYIRLNEVNSSANLVAREQVAGGMRVRLTKHWHAGLGWREDFTLNRTIQQSFTLSYIDECSTIEFLYLNDGTSDIGLETNNAFLVRFKLNSLVD